MNLRSQKPRMRKYATIVAALAGLAVGVLWSQPPPPAGAGAGQAIFIVGTVQAEAANVIDVDLVFTTSDGEPFPFGPTDFLAFDGDLRLSDSIPLTDATLFKVEETGAGLQAATTPTPMVLFLPSAGGAATLSVTDVVGASSTTVLLFVNPRIAGMTSNITGAGLFITLVFDGA